MSENGEIYSAGKNFTLPPAVTAWTNLTSEFDERSPVSLVFAVRKCEDGAWVEALLSEKETVFQCLKTRHHPLNVGNDCSIYKQG